MRDRFFKGLGVILSVLLVAVFSLLSLKPTSAENSRVITIYYDGKEQTVVTDAPTVGEVLNRADIKVSDDDLVEPGLKTLLSAPSYNVNIYRARPVTIIDGSDRRTIVTAHTSARQIAQDAGLDLRQEDETDLSRIDNFLAEDGVGLKLTIDRATPINLSLYGKQQVVLTQAATVSDFLKEKGVVLAKQDGVNLPLDTQLANNMSLEIWRDGVQTVTQDEEIGFTTEFIYDADEPVGYKELVESGVKGKKLVTYQIELRNGQEVSRTQIQSVEVEKPKKQVEIIGAKGQYTTPTENENITWDYLMAQGFSRVQTAGIMGNLMQEHKFNTSDTPNGIGIVQWTGSRRAALLVKPNPTNIYTQLDFLMEELNGKYASLRNAIKADSSADPTNVVVMFQNQFEKCGLCAEDKRIQYARNILASH
jgi:uncharacterized protein YabE (DUF348 family)